MFHKKMYNGSLLGTGIFFIFESRASEGNFYTQIFLAGSLFCTLGYCSGKGILPSKSMV